MSKKFAISFKRMMVAVCSLHTPMDLPSKRS